MNKKHVFIWKTFHTYSLFPLASVFIEINAIDLSEPFTICFNFKYPQAIMAFCKLPLRNDLLGIFFSPQGYNSSPTDRFIFAESE
jgi:hypothetical protein